jgi:two-component system cell cycle sensor histidine kinase/response regulator CckA
MGNHNQTPRPMVFRGLLLEDTPADAELSLRQLKRDGFEVEADIAHTPDEFKAKIRSKSYDIVLADYRLSGWTGMEALHWLRAEGYALPFILVSGTLADDLAVECVELGVTDYVSKDSLERLSLVVRRALQEDELRRQHNRTKQQLKESEKQYRLLLDINPHPMWVFDAQSFEFIEVNAAAVVHYGYSRSEFLSMTILDIRSAQDIPAVRQPVRIRPRGRLEAERWKHRRKDGTFIDVEISTHELRFYGRQAILAQARDITELLQNEERLRQSEERFSKAFRSSPLAITITTRAEGRYVDANDAFVKMVGLRWEEIVGCTAKELNVWDFPEDRGRMIQELERYGGAKAIETVFNSRTIGKRKVHVSAELIQLDGIPCILAIVNDVTDAKRLEEQFRQAQKMEAVGRLAGGVAHDFNNMLSVVLGFCDLAQERTSEESIARDLGHIKKAAQRASALTRQLLAFSRQQLLLPRVLNLNDVVRDISPMLSRVISKDISLTFVPAPSIGSVKADLGQLEQVLMNLVVNARDALPQGGKIFIETANAELDTTCNRPDEAVAPGRYVLLSVSDTGSGMDFQTVSRIFEPFFTTKPPSEGTGLGLSMVYGVIRQSGGYIRVYSEPGQGTTFRIYLPRIEGAAEPLPPIISETATKKGSETVLVVEDEQDLRELIIELLESEGYRGLEAKDGPSAIAVSEAHEKTIHVLLTDVVLPNMSGTVLAARIKETRPELNVLYMSGYTGNLIAHHGVLASGSAFIQKPFTKQSLLSEVRRVLDQ